MSQFCTVTNAMSVRPNYINTTLPNIFKDSVTPNRTHPNFNTSHVAEIFSLFKILVYFILSVLREYCNGVFVSWDYKLSM